MVYHLMKEMESERWGARDSRQLLHLEFFTFTKTKNNCARQPGFEPGTAGIGIQRASTAPQPQGPSGTQSCYLNSPGIYFLKPTPSSTPGGKSRWSCSRQRTMRHNQSQPSLWSQELAIIPMTTTRHATKQQHMGREFDWAVLKIGGQTWGWTIIVHSTERTQSLAIPFLA